MGQAWEDRLLDAELRLIRRSMGRLLPWTDYCWWCRYCFPDECRTCDAVYGPIHHPEDLCPIRRLAAEKGGE